MPSPTIPTILRLDLNEQEAAYVMATLAYACITLDSVAGVEVREDEYETVAAQLIVRSSLLPTGSITAIHDRLTALLRSAGYTTAKTLEEFRHDIGEPTT